MFVSHLINRMQLHIQTKELREAGETDLHIPLICDANTGWKMHDAVRVVNGVRDLDVYIEQPCLSYEECVSVRKMCPLPMVIDESMDDIGTLLCGGLSYFCVCVYTCMLVWQVSLCWIVRVLKDFTQFLCHTVQQKLLISV